MEKKQFKAESQRLMDLMINSIYTHKEIFLREIISNASDAIDKLAYQALTDETVGRSRSDFAIELKPDETARTLTVSDNGIGMDKDEIIAITRKLDTLETSIEPYEDCCTVFTPKHPKTKPRLDDVLKAEANMENLDEMMGRAVAGVKKVVIK